MKKTKINYMKTKTIRVVFAFLYVLFCMPLMSIEAQELQTVVGKADTILTFNVLAPNGLPSSAQISIGSSLNGWNPLDKKWVSKKIDDTHYQLTVRLDSNCIGANLEYKWTLQLAGQHDNGWTNVECTETGADISNRKCTIKSGENIINDQVCMFKNNQIHSTVTSGKLEIVELKMPQFSDGRTRKIRVWLPQGYDPSDTKKTYPVLYMNDGQNLFDAYTSYAGEWKVDESVSKMMKDGYQGAIIVGIDNGEVLRPNELSPEWNLSELGSKYITKPAGDKYAAFVTETVKPYIDAHYNTKPERKYTGIGGSSMGGTISFYIAMEYPQIYGYSMVLSPALHLYEDGTIEKYIENKHFSNVDRNILPSFYIYAVVQLGILNQAHHMMKHVLKSMLIL